MDYINISLHLCPPDGCGFDGWLLLVLLRSSQALETDFDPQKETMVTDDEASLPELLVFSLTLWFFFPLAAIPARVSVRAAIYHRLG